MNTEKFVDYKNKIISNCSRVILGKDEVISLITVSFICSGNVLLEDLPGTGKTMLLRAFSKTVGGEFKRIQFTPDLLPSDITGINFYNQKTGEFEFRPGPLFANIILADEINRATPRTQSSLLEAMEEKQITVDGVTTKLSEPFMVMATQNPIESYGTFPLPDAQLDRFFMRLSLGYPSREEELAVISGKSRLDIISELAQTVTPEETEYVRREFVNVSVSSDVADYIMDIVLATRVPGLFLSGVSTRGAIALYNASRAYAAISGRDYVIPEDVKAVAPFVLCHRIRSGRGGLNTDEFRRLVLDKVEVPLEKI